MRRASRSSLSFLLRTLDSTPRTRFLTSTTGHYLSQPSPRRHSSASTAYPFASSHPFRNYSHRAFSITAETPPPLDVEEAFEAARTTEDILSTFHALESLLAADDTRLGLACLKVGQHLDLIGHHDREKTLSFALRALSILEASHESPISIAMALHLIGSVNYSLQRFRDCLGYLNRANRILHSAKEPDLDEFDTKPVRHAVELLLANTKTAMGRREEAIVNLRNCLELKESMFDPNSREVGVAYRELAEAYVAALNFKEALPLCLKALGIHEQLLGQNSVEAAHDRRLLAIVYSGMEEHEKALEQNQLSKKVMRSWGLNSDIINAEIEAANMQIGLGRLEEALGTLKGIAQEADKDSHTRALVFITMAKALHSQEKSADAKRCLEIACGILEKREENYTHEAAEGYSDIAGIYENLNEFEIALSLLKRAAVLFEKLPQEQYAEANVSARIGWLLLLTGKVREGIPHLEIAAETLKEIFGPNHYAVGNIYNNLGAAYLELERPQSAAQMFTLAKDVMDVAFGRHHSDSIGVCQNLANAYDAMGNFDLALEFQKQVVDAWGKHGPVGAQNLQEAKKRLEEIEKRIAKQVLDTLAGEVSKLKERHAEADAHSSEAQSKCF